MTIHSRWQRGTVSIREGEAAGQGQRYSVDEMEADLLDLFGLLQVTNERLARWTTGLAPQETMNSTASYRLAG